MTPLRLGTRGSRLALAQARIAADALLATGVTARVELVRVETAGDRISASQPRGGALLTDGQFTSELETALRDGRIDAAVHSHKDLPTAGDPRLRVGAVLERGDPRDCLLIGGGGGGLDALPYGGRVATSSPRRVAQLRAVRGDIVGVPVRGNVETRLARLEAGEYDGLLLAAAGLERLGIGIPPAAYLSPDVVLPAPAQGALAIQVRAGDRAAALVEVVDHPASRIAVETERLLLRRIGGGCLAPLGVLAEVSGDRLRLRAALEIAGELARVDLSDRLEERARIVERAGAALLVGAPA